MRKSIFIAWVETRNFRFDGFGTSEDEAKKALFKGLSRHGTQYGIGSNWWQERALSDDVVVQEIKLGQCTRDGNVI